MSELTTGVMPAHGPVRRSKLALMGARFLEGDDPTDNPAPEPEEDPEQDPAPEPPAEEDPNAKLKKALATERAARKAADQRAARLEAEIASKDKSAEEIELDRAREEARREVTAKANERVLKAELRAQAVIAQEAVASMGRAADLSMMGGKKYTRYIRACAGSACSRCAILEGVWSSDTAFQRHPCCQCVAIPVDVEGKPTKATDREFNPQAFFDSLSAEEQDKRFTKAGAAAIRAGADPVAVVNARRGAYGIGYKSHGNAAAGTRGHLTPLVIGKKADGSPLKVYATVEGTTVRGAFAKAEAARTENAAKVGGYRRTTTVRLMPEQIMRMAGGDAARARELLTRYGYIN